MWQTATFRSLASTLPKPTLRMNSVSHKALFGYSVLIGIAMVLGMALYDRWSHPHLQVNSLTPLVWVTEQVQVRQIRNLSNRQFSTVIDMRPDGEQTDQPSSAEIGRAVREVGMAFSYIPVPHGKIPDDAVAALAAELSNAKGPVILYCRSGSRAARTWSLVEASKLTGMTAAAIKAAVTRSGLSTDDVDADIAQRIARRTKVAETKP